jgi:hypothetical protein
MAAVLCGALSGAVAAAAQSPAAASPFDPKAYIDHKESQKVQSGTKLTNLAIYRINGQRYMRFASTEGAVFLPSPGDHPEMHEEYALCSQHLRLLKEVLPVREGLAVDKDIRDHESFFIGLIRKCVEGRVSGPVASEEAPDGAVVETKAKEKTHDGTPNSDRKSGAAAP